MKITFLGVGEACDERLPNTSILMQMEVDYQKRSLLFDCGFTAPSCYWKHMETPDELDGLWISHFHGDHFFGIPALLLRFWEMGRQKPLKLLGQSGLEKIVHQSMDLAYPNFLKKLKYPLEFIEIEPGVSMNVLGVKWLSAENSHSQRSLAVRIENGRRSFFYSGDGAPTPHTRSLARGCDLIVHEAYGLEEITPSHGTVRQCIDFARAAEASALALVHFQRDTRRERHGEILKILENVKDFHAFLPEPNDVLNL